MENKDRPMMLDRLLELVKSGDAGVRGPTAGRRKKQGLPKITAKKRKKQKRAI
jgi:hypothetical protein